MAIELEVLKKYARKVNADDDALNTLFLNSAKQTVNAYLGYDFTDMAESKVEKYTLQEQTYGIKTKAFISSVAYIKVNGVDKTDNIIGTYKNRCDLDFQLTTGDVVDIEYTSLFDTSLLELTVYRIASLMATESDGNIGVTGNSFDGSSRTFTNYTNYDKYLNQIEHLRNLI